jgi:predicted RNase H-like nuclease (RuvC/YqgF family)
MFNKLTTIKNLKITSLQKNIFKCRQSISNLQANIKSLKTKIDFNHHNPSTGSFMAISIHHKTIKDEIKRCEENIQKEHKNIILIRKELEKENIELEKYKHILDEEKKQKLLKIKDIEAKELDDFLQK